MSATIKSKAYSNIEEQIAIIRRAIVETVPTERIYLFGSYVTGEFSSERGSDLDFYVVLDDAYEKKPLEAMQDISYALFGKKHVPTDVLANKSSRFDELAQVTTIEREVFNSGRLIYAK
ncbi:MAG: nucleotidyltransferase domain-containing protein [Coriobacteriales bacterium]|jgi:predicted nucleotidyltransferase|nr:nucleotidyltransferase domain-containing protein [Coriobacteriales bacterium]